MPIKMALPLFVLWLLLLALWTCRYALYLLRVFHGQVLPWRSRAAKLLYLFLFLSLTNFVAFAIVVALVGGSARQGKVENGRYFVRLGGPYFSVSPRTFQNMRMYEWITIHLLATGSVGFCVGTALDRASGKPSNLAER